jgi:mycofactocin system glycosyltransferase
LSDRRDEQLLARRLVWAGLLHATAPGSAMSPADVTVVIPVRDQPGMLATLVAALGDRRVIVVDDGSRDSSAIVGASRDATVVQGPGRGPAGARNASLEYVRTELVAFVDVDCVMPERWIEPLVRHFDDPLVAAVAPRIGAVDPGGARWIGAYEQARPALDRGSKPGLVRPRTPVPFVPTAVLIVRRQLTNGRFFDEGLSRGEDVDFVWRLTEAGWAVRYDPTIVVGHHPRTDVGSWVRQRAGYGASAGPLAQRHPGNLAPASLPVLPTAAVALLVARRPAAAAAVAGAGTAVVAHRLRGKLRHPVAEAVRLVGTGTAANLSGTASGLARAWGPVLAAVALSAPKRSLRSAATIALATPAVIEWARSEPRPRMVPYVLTHVADDVAYGCGVWAGSMRARTLRPLLPEFVLGRRTWPARPPDDSPAPT